LLPSLASITFALGNVKEAIPATAPDNIGKL
jgi:hypothetical protein